MRDDDNTPSSSSGETKSTSDSATAETGEGGNNSLGGMIFPWRHKPEPLPRLIEGTLENSIDAHLLGKTSTQMSPGRSTINALTTAFMFLDVPLYQFLFFGSWKDDLADSMSFAFTQGVACLLSNLSKEPVDKIVKDTYEVNFTKTIRIPADGNNDKDNSTTTTSEEEDVGRMMVPLEPMMEEKFISLYKNAQTENFKEDMEIEVCLKSVPVSAELYSLYCIPYISRENIQTDETLLEFYQDMLNKPSMERAPDLSKLRRERLEQGRMESTVIAQVLVWCNELFYVKDAATGQVLQGRNDSKSQHVPHLVRMEKMVRTEKNPNGSYRNIQENWIITDVDDMLGGNLII